MKGKKIPCIRKDSANMATNDIRPFPNIKSKVLYYTQLSTETSKLKK